ncbi:hypothetical protein FC89_GL002367 [Liquorilactobacillus ghanensis DSM 18630]|uniref:Abi family protein n=1 Tax=Liquorilactobacillus ghanensis DSM 18630 TaxID=1423750 RepID=A0A0R1VPP0_9LACO|nr:Abi family protein [Liquorilactobacillus ghanensis]KRM07808.1 hypothetical protein FC89_GL002367 [Liquorilactobacillus ghanensis DSM 18630]
MADKNHNLQLTYNNIKKLKQHKQVILEDQTCIIPEVKTFPLDTFYKKEQIILDPPVPLTTDELIALLKEHHTITFTEEEETFAQSIIPYAGYGRLSAFALNDTPISFTELFDIYSIDRYLRTSITRLMPSIETVLKNRLSQEIISFENNNNAFIYENIDSKIWRQNKKDKVKNWLAFSIETMLDIRNKRPSLSKLFRKYNGHLPIWILLDNLTFGSISLLLPLLNKDLVFDSSKCLIDAQPSSIYSLCQGLVILRNAVYHNSSVLGTTFTYSMKLDEEVEKFIITGFMDIFPEKENTLIIDKTKHFLFVGLLAMKIFYSKLPIPEIDRWNIFISKLDKKIKSHSVIALNLAPRYYFPTNWKNILEIKIS